MDQRWGWDAILPRSDRYAFASAVATAVGSTTTACYTTGSMMKKLNRDDIFTNFDDDLEGLRDQLSNRFEHPRIDIVGTVALFSARL